MSLYHRYRPNKLEELFGNEALIESLSSSLKKKDKPHAILLTGPFGCGKTSVGRIIANELHSSGSDYREIDSASFRGIDTIREIRQQSLYKPIESSCRVYLLDEIHQLGSAAMPALLKALEDTPPHVYYILCTTDPQKLLPTIRSRCSTFEVSLLTEKQMYRLLRHVVKSEGETMEEEVYEQIIQDAMGHPRNALQILDQVIGVNPGKRIEVARRSAETQSAVIELCRALMQRKGWKAITAILTGLKDEDVERVRRAVRGYCTTVLLRESNTQTCNRAALIMENMNKLFYDQTDLVFACYSITVE